MEDALELKLEILADQGIALIRCSGRLRFGKEAQLLKKCVESVLSQFSVCILGLKAVDQIDARGLGTIIACFEKARSLGSLLLIGGTSEKAQDLFAMMKVDRVLEIYASEDEAISACCQAA